MILITASNPIWIVFVSALAFFAIGSFWPRRCAWLRWTALGLCLTALGTGIGILVANTLHGCYPIWTGLTPAVVVFDGDPGDMTVCPGQTVIVSRHAIIPYLPVLPGPPPSGTDLEREEPGRGI